MAGLIERSDNHMLIERVGAGRDAMEGTGLWTFPRDLANEHETPEQAIRRMAVEQLGLTIEVVAGQPPLMENIDGQATELRYFFCGVISGEVKETTDNHLRWIPKAHLREYDFDVPSQPVVEWLLKA